MDTITEKVVVSVLVVNLLTAGFLQGILVFNMKDGNRITGNLKILHKTDMLEWAICSEICRHDGIGANDIGRNSSGCKVHRIS